MVKELEGLSALVSEPMSFLFLSVNLVVGTFLALIIRWHFQKYGTSLI